jgi:hypothetical protein
MYEYPSPGGEPDFAPSFRLREATSGKPLWHASRHPPNFPLISSAAKTSEKQAAPANVCSRRNSITAYDGLKKSHDNSSRWVIPGSRLLNQFHVRIETGNEYARSRVSCQSGLPDVASRSLNDGAKSGSPPGDGHSDAPRREPNRGRGRRRLMHRRRS